MEAWEVEEAVAEHFNSKWEEMNEPDESANLLVTAFHPLSKACDLLNEAIDKVGEAADDVEELPVTDKIQSYVNELESILFDLRNMRDKFERGEC